MENEVDFLEDYDDCTNDVVGANVQSYKSNLRKWFAIIDQNPVARHIFKSLLEAVNGKAWIEQQVSENSRRDDYEIEWPADRRQSLAVRLQLFKQFANGERDPHTFAFGFFDTGAKLLDDLNEINGQLFRPLVGELRKEIVRAFRDIGSGDTALASDRIVKRSDNVDKFDEAISKLDTVIASLRSNNSYSNFEEKQRLIAEIVAGKDLLKQSEVRKLAIGATVFAALSYLAFKTVDSLVDQAVSAAIKSLSAIFGFGVP